MNNNELWNLSSYIQKESFFQSQLKSVGIQKTKYMERYQKNIMGSKRSNLYTNLIMSFYLLFFAVLPIVSLITLSKTTINSSNIYNQLFSNAYITGTYFLFNLIYYFLIGFLPMMEFLQGKTFKYLRTLPLTAKDIEWITIFTVIRMNGIQLAVIIFVVPVAIMIFFQNILLAGVFLALNILNATFMFYLFLNFSNFMSHKVFNNPKASKLLTFVRVSVSFISIISIFALSFVYELIPILTNASFLNTYFGTNHTVYVNLISSIIFFPLSSGYVISIIALPTNLISTTVLESSIIGIIIFLLITFHLLRKGNKIIARLLYEDSSESVKEVKVELEPDKINIKVNGPKVAYIKRIFIMATREQGKLVVFLIPLIISVFFAFSFSSSSLGNENLDPFFGLFFYISFLPYILNNGLSEAEEGLGGLLSILPIKNRDIFRSKQYIIIGEGFLVSIVYIAVIGINNINLYIDSVIKVIFLIIIEPAIYLLLFSVTFGKINSKYTTFRVNTDNSLRKYIVILGTQFVFMGIITGITVPTLYYLIGLDLAILVIVDIIVRIVIK